MGTPDLSDPPVLATDLLQRSEVGGRHLSRDLLDSAAEMQSPGLVASWAWGGGRTPASPDPPQSPFAWWLRQIRPHSLPQTHAQGELSAAAWWPSWSACAAVVAGAGPASPSPRVWPAREGR